VLVDGEHHEKQHRGRNADAADHGEVKVFRHENHPRIADFFPWGKRKARPRDVSRGRVGITGSGGGRRERGEKLEGGKKEKHTYYGKKRIKSES